MQKYRRYDKTIIHCIVAGNIATFGDCAGGRWAGQTAGEENQDRNDKASKETECLIDIRSEACGAKT